MDPMPITPAGANTMALATVLRGECYPEKLELVDVATMPDGTRLDGDHIRGIVENA